MEEKITLQDCLEMTEKFIKGEITKEEFGEFGGKLTIRAYLPLQEKVGIIMSLINYYLYEDVGKEMQIANLYKNIFFATIMQGYAMVDCSDLDKWTVENYDILYPIFSPFILTFAKEDYKLINNMLHDTINMYNIENLTDGLASLDYNALQASVESNNELIKDIENNKELVDNLASILRVNDPYTTQLAEELRAKAIEKAREEE